VDPNAPILPNRDVIVRLDRPLAPGAKYVITVQSLENLHGRRGGGVADFDTPEIARSARPDTGFVQLRR
jgi:hypothetical protein